MIATSSALGVGSPLGWLWTRMIAAADSSMTGTKTSRGWTSDAVSEPSEMRTCLIGRFLPSRRRTWNSSLRSAARPRAAVPVDLGAGAERRAAREAMLGVAARQLADRANGAARAGPMPATVAERARRRVDERPERAEAREQGLAAIERAAAAARPGRQQDREQLGVAEVAGPLVEELLARPIGRRPVLDRVRSTASFGAWRPCVGVTRPFRVARHAIAAAASPRTATRTHCLTTCAARPLRGARPPRPSTADRGELLDHHLAHVIAERLDRRELRQARSARAPGSRCRRGCGASGRTSAARRAVPSITIGTIGSRWRRARVKAPCLKSRISPVGERVPSGKIMTELPRRVRRRSARASARRRRRRRA